MKTLNSLSDLEQYGLSYLTGEACALSQRLLFDLNQDGVDLVKEYFGLLPGSMLAGNWNSQVNGKPAVASILLPKHPEFYQELFKFLLFREGFDVVAIYGGVVSGMSDAELEEYGFQSLTGLLCRNPRGDG